MATNIDKLHPDRLVLCCVYDAISSSNKTPACTNRWHAFFVFVLTWTINIDVSTDPHLTVFTNLQVANIIHLVQLSFSYVLYLETTRVATLIAKLAEHKAWQCGCKPNDEFLLNLLERVASWPTMLAFYLERIVEIKNTIYSTFQQFTSENVCFDKISKTDSETRQVFKYCYFPDFEKATIQSRDSIKTGHIDVLSQIDDLSNLEGIIYRNSTGIMQMPIDERELIDIAFSAGLDSLHTASNGIIFPDLIREALESHQIFAMRSGP